jgi:salicylate hydroxylase
MYGVVAIVPESPEFAATLKWARSVGSEGLQRLRQRFSVILALPYKTFKRLTNGFDQNWDPIIDQVLQTMTDIDAYPLDSGPWMKELVRDDRIAFVGDAAHREF